VADEAFSCIPEIPDGWYSRDDVVREIDASRERYREGGSE
jgi:hypothetical protein